MIKKIILIIFFCTFIVTSCSKKDESQSEKNENKSGITGTIVYQGTPVNWAYAYVYPTQNTDFRQQYTEASEPTGTDAKFTIYVKPGKYYLAARKRWNYAKVGPLRTGDFSADYFNNPVTVKENSIINIGEIELNEIREEADNIPEGCGIKGKVFLDEIKKSDIYIYIYTNMDTDLRGPSYYIVKKISEDGTFKINLLPGKYYLVARKRKTGSKLGPLEEEDYNFVYLLNPVNVIKNEYFNIAELRLKKIDPKKLNAIKKGTLPNQKKLTSGIKGTITNKKGTPVENVYTFVYKDYQMVGKPLFRSIPTQKDGKYEISLNEDGMYYIGARNTYGGPLEPGDLVGSYNGTPDHLIKIKKGEILENIDIVVEEFQ
ncbi:hypothetical protein HZA55_07900 [Candidatus Poribacteria bacterium]|nr:hypothetical protein [Candidatus Poribacteria bacterium]